MDMGNLNGSLKGSAEYRRGSKMEEAGYSSRHPRGLSVNICLRLSWRTQVRAFLPLSQAARRESFDAD